MLLSSLIISNCEDHVLFVLIHLSGVLCPLLRFFSSYQVLHLFSTGVLSEFVLPYSFFSQRSVFQLLPPPLLSFFLFVQPLKVIHFHSFVKGATQFYLLSTSSFSLWCHPRSRDKILLQWWSVVTTRDRCARCLPVIRRCCHVICLRVAFYHVIMCIASSCFQNLHPSGFPPVLFVVRSEPRHTCTRPRHV